MRSKSGILWLLLFWHHCRVSGALPRVFPEASGIFRVVSAPPQPHSEMLHGLSMSARSFTNKAYHQPGDDEGPNLEGQGTGHFFAPRTCTKDRILTVSDYSRLTSPHFPSIRPTRAHIGTAIIIDEGMMLQAAVMLAT